MVGRSGSSFVDSFFASRELNARPSLQLESEEQLWTFLSANLATDDERAAGHRSPLEKATKAGPLSFRGQSFAGHGVSSSLHRFIKAETKRPITEALFFKVERSILEAARSRGLGKGLPDGHLLMLLQHYGIPTRLLDVSTGALEALYFATEHQDASDGRVFIFKIIERDGWQTYVDLESSQLPWTENPGGIWTETVAVVEPLALDPRMGAQRSKFLVGGTIRASADRNIHFEGHNNFLDKDELPQITTLSIGFHKTAPGMTRTPWHCLGWSIRIPAEWKSSLRKRLAQADISRDSMYPPFANVQWEATSAARDMISADAD